MYKRARGLNDDPLSAASAGLLALGIERSRRAEALELLAAMLDLADDQGDVLLDGALFAVEQRMGVDGCLEIYSWLELLDVVERTGDGWRICAFAEHNGPAGDTLASLEVLRRHLDSVGQEDVASAEPVSAPVVTMRRWRRTVPMAAAGLAASVAVVTGVAQFVPQAAVSGRNAAERRAVPTTSAPLRSTVNSVVGAGNAVTGGTAVTALNPTTTLAGAPATPSTTGIVSNIAGTVACAVPNVVTAVSSVELVRLALAGEHGERLWAAVVSGTATLRNQSEGLLLPSLEVVAHVVDGDTAPVLATLAAPLLLPDLPSPFTAIVVLGATKPTTAVTASAVATGFKGC